MIDVLNTFLASRGIYCLVFILFFLGIYGMIACKNYMKKMMCMNIMQISVILFFLCFSQKAGGMIPVLDGISKEAAAYANPLPHALMLTAIVVSLGTTGVALALLMRMKETYGSVEEDVILQKKAAVELTQKKEAVKPAQKKVPVESVQKAAMKPAQKTAEKARRKQP